MFNGFTPKCPKCGRELRGVTLDYKLPWECSGCAEDRKDPIHCERGCEVKFAHPNNGHEYQKKAARELLTEGAVYEVDEVHVGGCYSEILLKRFPGTRFNSVFFDRYEQKGVTEC